MMMKRLLRRDHRGIGAVEFALVAPVLISFVIGISQVGKLFFANADMKNAIASGARVASVWPVPQDDSTIVSAVNGRLARTGGVAASTVAIARGTDGNGNDFLDIKMTYKVPLEFIFFKIGPVTLSDSRRVYTQMDGTAPVNNTSTSTTSTTGGTTSTTGGTTSTTGGTTSSTSATSAGGTTSSTSATSAGGTTSSTSATSASSTGGTTSTTSASTSSTTSASSTSTGGHVHGNCNKKC